MKTPDRGLKHHCPDCETKYYDLKMAPAVCPKCGTKAPAIKVRKASPIYKKASTSTFGRFR